jgi:TolA-binding protein
VLVAAPSAEEKHSVRALGEQVALVDRARSALEEGDAAGTLRAMVEYDTRFPGGPLSQEVMFLGVEALVQRGDMRGAATLGQRLLAAYPSSLHAAKVRQLIAGASNNP